MVTYIYFVKCPNCEDEHFDFFDDAKAFALGCLSQKPIITQTEVCRNDFGECTDSCDLGTVWSWEDMMKDAEPEDTVFSKDETFGISEGLDDFDDFDIGPQIDEFDNSLDFEIEDEEVSERESGYYDFEESCRKPITEATEIPSDDCYVITTTEGTTRFYIKKIDFNSGVLPEEPYDWFTTDLSNAQTFSSAKMAGEYFAERKLADNVFALGPNNRRVRFYDYVKTPYECWLIDAGYIKEACSERKPIPEGMTIEQLVEEMEENEDTVECTQCNELFDKSTCRKELNLGWCCSRCADDLIARGEGPVFKSDNYWDFLDEDVESLGEAKAATTTIPNFTYLAGEASARDKIIDELLNQKVFGVRRNRNGSIEVYAYVAYDYWGTIIKDINVTPNGRIILDCLDNRTNEIHQRDLQVLVDSKPKRGDGSKFLTTLKNIATKLNKELDPRTRRERRDDAVAVRVTDEIAEYLRDHITNIHFKVPMQTYDRADIKDIDANYEASDETCEAAANRINSIYDRFFSQPFADAAEAAGMVSDRIPNEPAAWIANNWGAEAKITFDKPIKDLVINKGTEDEVKISDLIQAYQWKATTKVNVEKNVVDCFSLAVMLIRRFYNDVRFFEKKSAAKDVEESFEFKI
jgi:hypothetical protein